MGVVDYGLNIQEAVNAPRFHHQWLPDEITGEDRLFARHARACCEHKGHKIRRNTWSDGECIESTQNWERRASDAIDRKTGER